MNRRRPHPLMLLLVLLPAAALAQGDPPPEFRVPRAGLGFKFGGYFPTGDSEAWDVNTEVLTTRPSDFNDFAFGIEVAYRLSNYFDLSLDLELYEGTSNSEYREFVDQTGLPIRQSSWLSLLPVTFNVRWAPGGRFRRDAAGFLRVPRRAVPYVAVGGGLYFWEYLMEGDFVDLGTLSIFPAHFADSGAALGAAAALGIEVPVSPTWSLLLEARRHWAKASLRGGFPGTGTLDLGGTSFFLGTVMQF